jgi:hypothetical protein
MPVPTFSGVQIFPQNLDLPNRITITYEVPACNFVQVLWGLKGSQPVQEKIDVSGAGQVPFTAMPTSPGSTYSFRAQACMNMPLAPAKCSPWTVAVDVNARSNCHSLANFYSESFYGQKPSKNYPVPVRWLLAGSKFVPYNQSIPYYQRAASVRPVLGI